MNTNSNLQVINSDAERMTSVIIDIEAQNESREETNEETKSELQIPLKGILKRPDENLVDRRVVEDRLLRLCLSLLVIVIMSPIIICDLYFGFTDKSCSREQPDELEISLRLYLIVSGFVSASALIMILSAITFVEPNRDYESDPCKMLFGSCALCCGAIGLVCMAVFNLIWNILGAVVFWGYIYGNGNCNRTFSTYVFVSLIIKFVASLFSYQLNKKDKR